MPGKVWKKEGLEFRLHPAGYAVTSLGGGKGPIQQKVFNPSSSTDPYFMEMIL